MNEDDMTSGSLSDESRNLIRDRSFLNMTSDSGFGWEFSPIWISLSCKMDLSKFYVLFALCQKSKLKFDQDSKACWNFCFEQKVLNEKLMPNKLLNLCLRHFVNQKGNLLTPIEIIHHHSLYWRSNPGLLRAFHLKQDRKRVG